MPEYFVPQLALKVNGSDLSADFYGALTEARAECSVQLPDQLRLKFIDPDFDLYDQGFWEVGAEVTMSISNSDVPAKVMTGDVTSIGIEADGDGSMTLTITALGADHVLYRGVRRATYVDSTDSEIASSIASEFGLSASVDASEIRHPYVMQAGPSNRFLDERARLNGYRWWVVGKELNFKKDVASTNGPTLRWGEHLLSLRVVSTTAETAKKVTVNSWNPDTRQAITVTSSLPPDLELLGTDAPGPTSIAKSSRGSAAVERFQACHPTDDISGAQALADGIGKRAAATEVNVRGVALGDPKIMAGSIIHIENVGTKLSGKYRIASVEHVYTAAGGYVTRFTSGGQESTGLVDLLSSPAEPLPWNSHALVIGVVTNLDDPERPARVKVNLPTFHDEYESAWARLVLPGAGKERGLQIYPEIDDEVLVGFENGDPQRPVILGGMWSKKSPPPLAKDAIVKQGVIASRTWKSRAGHSITINDADADSGNSIVVALKGGKTVLTLAADKVTLETPSDITITTDGAASLKANRDVTIEGQNVNIKATSAVKLNGAQIEAVASSTAKFEGALVDLKASGRLAVDGGGATQIKGGMVQLN